MLRIEAGQTCSLFDVVLPQRLRQLPADLAAIDQLLMEDKMLEPLRAHWQKEVEAGQIKSASWGRPTISMQAYVRLMVLKHRYGWGYESLAKEVSDSLHLRQFCGIPLHEEVPDESTVRKLTKRLGSEAVNELSRSLIKMATSERRIRLRAMRCDSTVVEADVKYPTDIGLVGNAVRVLVRTAKKLVAQLPEVTAKVRDRGRASPNPDAYPEPGSAPPQWRRQDGSRASNHRGGQSPVSHRPRGQEGPRPGQASDRKDVSTFGVRRDGDPPPAAPGR